MEIPFPNKDRRKEIIKKFTKLRKKLKDEKERFEKEIKKKEKDLNNFVKEIT